MENKNKLKFVYILSFAFQHNNSRWIYLNLDFCFRKQYSIVNILIEILKLNKNIYINYCEVFRNLSTYLDSISIIIDKTQFSQCDRDIRGCTICSPVYEGERIGVEILIYWTYRLRPNFNSLMLIDSSALYAQRILIHRYNLAIE